MNREYYSMRKILIFFLFAIPFSISAQERLAKPEIYFGANFGVTESMIMFNPTINQGFLMGYNGGLVFRYIDEKNVGMQAELNFSQRGWSESTTKTYSIPNSINIPQNGLTRLSTNPTGLYKHVNQTLTKSYVSFYSRQLNYIELPFMTHIYIGKKNRFFINFGPKISYLLFQSVKTNDLNSTDVQRSTLIQNPFDYGLCAGFGFLFNINKNIFQFDTRAYYALSDIYSNSKLDYFANSNNLNLSVNLAWLIQVK